MRKTELGHGVRVIKPIDVLTTAHALAGGFGLGALGGLAILLTALFFDRVVVFSTALVVVAITIVFTAHDAYRIRSLKQAYVAGCGWGVGVFMTAISTTMVELISSPSQSKLWVLLGFIAGAAGCGLLPLLVVTLQRTLGPEIILQDGTLCPSCAYILIGNITRVCPECGRGYSPEELSPRNEVVPVESGPLENALENTPLRTSNRRARADGPPQTRPDVRRRANSRGRT